MERVKDEWEPTRQAEIDAQKEELISNEEILEIIREAEQTTGMNLDQYKKAITERKIKNYSIVQLRMWEQVEQLKKEARKNKTGL
ncbi:hypothetical protein PB1_12894 [Bacillus methanolicus PB1]|uniref:Uncharacterized protein n=1 Tax=Bacillus methanolicus PB1 TaxID=997296 RepID=I3DW34_BACMT|nr:hypothetical protein [Bacillus methanolicus]EIJ78455.1 hypothetical protein PB1_12894 [Bacillus methanolicus PB1]